MPVSLASSLEIRSVTIYLYVSYMNNEFTQAPMRKIVKFQKSKKNTNLRLESFLTQTANAWYKLPSRS